MIVPKSILVNYILMIVPSLFYYAGPTLWNEFNWKTCRPTYP